ncbi:MAG TPA: SH3-like domain-containing protein [Streptosporangiaceae bacterium]|jgi:nitrile hydratase
MSEAAARFVAGDRVATQAVDPDHHNRLPRYARGQVGEVVEVQGTWPLPDDVVRGVPAPRVEPVYTVRFAARDLWGTGGHEVTVDLWQSYLIPARHPPSTDASLEPVEDLHE